MPKQRITREMIIEAAFALVQESGPEALTVGAIAARLGCSVQPIYSYCRSMAGLRREVAARAAEALQAHLAASLDEGDLFCSTGQAYLQFARQQPHLFRLAVLHRRQGIGSWQQLYRQEAAPRMAGRIAAQLGIPEPTARQLHLHLLIYTMGLGAIFSCCEPGIGEAEALAQQQAAYEAFLAAARAGSLQGQAPETFADPNEPADPAEPAAPGGPAPEEERR